MAEIDWNKPEYRTRLFKGYVQFQIPDGTNFYRLKERQAVSVSFTFNHNAHWNDEGLKYIDPAGHSHSFSMTLKVTADMIDDATGNWQDPTSRATSGSAITSEKQTISYWIEKCQRFEPIEIIFVTTAEALAGPSGEATEKYIKIKLRCVPNQFGPMQWTGTEVSQNVTVSGQVLDIIYLKRTATSATS